MKCVVYIRFSSDFGSTLCTVQIFCSKHQYKMSTLVQCLSMGGMFLRIDHMVVVPGWFMSRTSLLYSLNRLNYCRVSLNVWYVSGIASSIARAISCALPNVSFDSCKSCFWICGSLMPHTRRSLIISFISEYLQCSASALSEAMNAATVSPGWRVLELNLYRWKISEGGGQ